MKSLRTKKRGVDRPLIIAVGFVLLILTLPVLIYVLQLRQTLKQNAQVTPPPPPPGCYYIPAKCSEDPNCDPGSKMIVCTYSLTPTTAVSPADTQQTTGQQESPFSALVNWFNSLFK